MKIFYVYAVKANGEICYVGKGHRDTETGYDRVKHYTKLWRAHRSASLYNELKRRLDAGQELSTEVLEDDLTEAQSFAREKVWISTLESQGARLINLTSGGHSGWTLSPASCKKMSDIRRGKKLGPMSNDAKIAMSEAKRLKRLVQLDVPKMVKRYSVVTIRDGVELLYSAVSVGVEILEKARLMTEQVYRGKEPRSLVCLAREMARRYPNGGLKLSIEFSSDSKEECVEVERRYCGLNPNPRAIRVGIIMVVGVSGSGKSWVCRQLRGVEYHPWDENERGISYCVKAETLYKIKRVPVVIDPTVCVSWILKRLKARLLRVLMCVVLETEETVRERITARGGEFTEAMASRMARFRFLSRYAWFSGTSAECLGKILEAVYPPPS